MIKLILMILGSILIASQVQAKAVDEYTDQEIQEIVSVHPGCTITKDVEEGSIKFKLVPVPAEEEEFAYFIELTEPNDNKVFLYFKKTANIGGLQEGRVGYTLDASEESYRRGWNLEVTLILSDTYDFTLDYAKDGWFGETFEGFESCKNLK